MEIYHIPGCSTRTPNTPITKKEIKEILKTARRSNNQRYNSSRNNDMTEELWEKTKRDVDRRYLKTNKRPKSKVLRSSIISNRFGVRQPIKVRPIDDYSASLINSCIRTKDKIVMTTIDHAIDLLRRMKTCTERRKNRKV